MLLFPECIYRKNHKLSRLIFSDLEICGYSSSQPRQRTKFRPLIVHLTRKMPSHRAQRV